MVSMVLPPWAAMEMHMETPSTQQRLHQLGCHRRHRHDQSLQQLEPHHHQRLHH